MPGHDDLDNRLSKTSSLLRRQCILDEGGNLSIDAHYCGLQ